MDAQGDRLPRNRSDDTPAGPSTGDKVTTATTAREDRAGERTGASLCLPVPFHIGHKGTLVTGMVNICRCVVTHVTRDCLTRHMDTSWPARIDLLDHGVTVDVWVCAGYSPIADTRRDSRLSEVL